MEFNYSIGFKVKKKTIKKFIIKMVKNILTLQFSSVAQSCPTLCDPMSRSTPGLPLPLHHHLLELQFTSVPQSCPTLCDPMSRSTPGLPVHHQLPEFTQTRVRQVSDAIQPSHPRSSPSPPAPNPSQHQSLFQ